MAKYDDDVDFDIDSLDDLDVPDIDIMPDDSAAADNRTPATRVADGALKSILRTSTARTAARAIKENALPEGYSMAIDAADDALSLGQDLYDAAAKELEPAVKAAQKMLRKSQEKADKYLPKWLADTVKKLGGEAEEARQYVDPNESAIAGSLGAIFDKYREATAQTAATEANLTLDDKQRSVDRKITIEQGNRQYNQLTTISEGISKLVGYQESVLFDYQRKSLELQHRQYFAARDLLTVTKAMADQNIHELKAIVKNTGLPEAVKLRLSEQYGQLAKADIIGRVQGSVHDFMSNYTSDFRDRAFKKITGAARDLKDGVLMGADMYEQMSEMGETMDEAGIDRARMAGEQLGNLGTSAAFKFGARAIGDRLVTRNKYQERSRLIKILDPDNRLSSRAAKALEARIQQYEASGEPLDLQALTDKESYEDKRVGEEIAETISGDSGLFGIRKRKINAQFKRVLNAGETVERGRFLRGADTMQYLIENAPKVANDWARSGRSVFDNVEVENETLQRLLESGGVQAVEDFIRELAPTFKESFSVNSNLHADAANAVGFDLLTRRSIIEIIPGYLSRILQQVTTLATGEPAERITYSTEREQFVGQSTQDTIVASRLFDQRNVDNRLNDADAVTKLLGGENLDDDVKAALNRRILQLRDDGSTLSLKNLRKTSVAGEDEGLTAALETFLDSEDINFDSENKIKLSRLYDRITAMTRDVNQGLADTNKVADKETLYRLGIVDPKTGKVNAEKVRAYIDGRLRPGEGGEGPAPSADPSPLPAPGPETAPITDDTLTHEYLDLILDAITSGNSGTLTAIEGIQFDAADIGTHERLDAIASTLSEGFEGTYGRLDAITNKAGETGTFSNTVNYNTTSTVNWDDFTPQRKLLVEELFSQFTTLTSTYDGIPIAVDLRSEAPQGTLDASPTHERLDAILDAINGNFETNHVLLQAVAENAGRGGEGGGTVSVEEMGSGLLGKLRSGAGSLVGMLGSYYSWLGRTSLKTVQTAKDAALDVGDRVLKGTGVTGVRDIYVKGKPGVVISAKGLRNGWYFDAETKAPIATIEDVQGPVVDLDGNFVLTQEDYDLGIEDRFGNTLIDAGKGLMRGLGKIYGAQFAFMGAVLKAPLAALDKVKGRFDGVKDVYVKGESTPRMRALLMRNGGYISSRSQKVITHQGQIDGEVLDSKGNVVISLDDIETGLVDRWGIDIEAKGLSGLLGGLAGRGLELGGKLLGKGAKLYGQYLKGVGKVTAGAAGAAWGVVKEGGRRLAGGGGMTREEMMDMFREMQGGGTPELDPSERETLSLWQKLKDQNLTPDMLKSMDLDELKARIPDLNMDALNVGSMEELTAKLSEVGESVRQALTGNQMDIGSRKLLPVLIEQLNVQQGIYRHLTGESWSGPGTDIIRDSYDDILANDDNVSGLKDTVAKVTDNFAREVGKEDDEEGHREGSWRDQRSQLTPEEVKVKEEEKKEEKEERNSWLMDIIGSLGGLFMSGIGALGDKLMIAMGIKSAASTAGDVLDGVDALGNARGTPPGGRKPGLLGKSWKLLKRGAKGARGLLKRGALAAAPLLASSNVGAMALSGASSLASGAAAIGGAIAAAPVGLIIGGAVAAGAAAYGGYKLWSHFRDNASLEPLEALRFMQYGIDTTDQEFIAHVRRIEREFIDDVRWEGMRATFKGDQQEYFKEFGEDMGMDLTNMNDATEWQTWFVKRFGPILLTHLTVLKKIDDSVDVTDVDDELDPKYHADYIKRVQITAEDVASGFNPYEWVASPFKGHEVRNMVEEISEYTDVLLKAAEAGNVDEVEVDSKGNFSSLVEGAKKVYDNVAKVVPGVALIGKAASTVSSAVNTVTESVREKGVLGAAKAGITAVAGSIPFIGGFFKKDEEEEAQSSGKLAPGAKWTLLRMMMYGFGKDTNPDAIKAVMELERRLWKKTESIRITGELKIDWFTLYREVAVSFNRHPADKNGMLKWIKWFKDRFAPAFAVYVYALHAATGEDSLLDSDARLDEMDAETRKLFLNRIKMEQIPPKLRVHPYEVMSNPYEGVPITSTKKDIYAYIELLNRAEEVNVDEGVTGSSEVKHGILASIWGKVTEKAENIKVGVTAAITAVSEKGVVGTLSDAVRKATPVIAKAIPGAGAVMYLGGKAVEALRKDTDVEPIEGLRLLQYGVNLKDRTFVKRVRELELLVLDTITWVGKRAEITEDPEYFFKQMAESMGLSFTNEENAKAWTTWFAKRFTPVLLTHLQTLKLLDEILELEEIDKRMSVEMKIEYVNRVQFTANDIASGKDPYVITDSPMYGVVVESLREVIAVYTKRLLDTLATGRINNNQSFMPPEVKASDKATEAISQAKETQQAISKQRSEEAKSKAGNNSPVETANGMGRSEMGSASNGDAPDTDGNMPAGVPDAPSNMKPTGDGSMLMPAQGRISSAYGRRMHPTRKEMHGHGGIDIAAPTGTPVYASMDGTISRQYRSSSYGNVIYINHPDGRATRYAHLSRFAAGTGAGAVVKQGQLIGYVGSTGVSTGPHLHFEVREGHAQRSPTADPMKFIGPAREMLAQQEKEVKEAERGDDIGDQDFSLEGVDTIASTTLKKPVLADAGIADDDPSVNATANNDPVAGALHVSPKVGPSGVDGTLTAQTGGTANLPDVGAGAAGVDVERLVGEQTKHASEAQRLRERQVMTQEETNAKMDRLIAAIENQQPPQVNVSAGEPSQPKGTKPNTPVGRRKGDSQGSGYNGVVGFDYS
jgi:murein DD-endopeptidase MepM/ murein hydrolase activator NlpD